MRVALVILVGALLAGCGNDRNPMAPSAPAPTNIAGAWTGTFTYTSVTTGGRIVEAVTATFTQADANVTGETRHAQGGRSIVSGVMNSSTLTASLQFVTPSGCSGTASISGNVSSGVLRFSIPSLASTNCRLFTNGDFVLNR